MGPGARWAGPLGLEVLPTSPYGVAWWVANVLLPEELRGPAGLATGDQAAQGDPPLDEPPKTDDRKLVADFFEHQVRVLLCQMALPDVRHLKLAAIRDLAKKEDVPSPGKALGFTRLRLQTVKIKETTVPGKKWLTAIARLEATEIVLPSELWLDAEIPPVPGRDRTKQIEDFHAAHQELLDHERGHMKEAFAYLSEVRLGYEAAYASSAALPTLAEFRAQVSSADRTAGEVGGPLQASAEYWDDQDSFLTNRMASHGVRIDDGMNPGKPHYDPP